MTATAATLETLTALTVGSRVFCVDGIAAGKSGTIASEQGAYRGRRLVMVTLDSGTPELYDVRGLRAALVPAETAATLEALEETTPTDDTAPVADFRGQLPTGNRRRFMLAGRAIVTVRNPVTGNRFTFRVTKSDVVDNRPAVWFVSVLTGEDSQYTYLGTIFADGTFRVTKKSRIAADAPSARAFAWFAANLESARVDVWHEGRCGRCGRALTVPESIESGLGPVCAGLA